MGLPTGTKWDGNKTEMRFVHSYGDDEEKVGQDLQYVQRARNKHLLVCARACVRACVCVSVCMLRIRVRWIVDSDLDSSNVRNCINAQICIMCTVAPRSKCKKVQKSLRRTRWSETKLLSLWINCKILDFFSLPLSPVRTHAHTSKTSVIA